MELTNIFVSRPNKRAMGYIGWVFSSNWPRYDGVTYIKATMKISDVPSWQYFIGNNQWVLGTLGTHEDSIVSIVFYF